MMETMTKKWSRSVKWSKPQSMDGYSSDTTSPGGEIEKKILQGSEIYDMNVRIQWHRDHKNTCNLYHVFNILRVVSNAQKDDY